MPFEVINQNDYILVKMLGDCIGDEKPSMFEAFEKMADETKLKYAVFMAADCSAVSVSFLRQMSLAHKQLKLLNGSIRVVGANDSVKQSILHNGLDRILICKMSLRGALVDFGLAKQKEIDANVINPFLNAVIKVLKIQCSIEAKPQKPRIKAPTDPLLLGDVSGIISIVSETFNGTLAISMSEKVFLKIAENMLGEKCDAVTDANVDLIGELANIILGQAKIELGQLGYAIQMAIPSCVWGKDHKIKHFGGGMCIVLPFDTDIEPIYCEVMTNNPAMQKLTKKSA